MKPGFGSPSFSFFSPCAPVFDRNILDRVWCKKSKPASLQDSALSSDYTPGQRCTRGCVSNVVPTIVARLKQTLAFSRGRLGHRTLLQRDWLPRSIGIKVSLHTERARRLFSTSPGYLRRMYRSTPQCLSKRRPYWTSGQSLGLSPSAL